MSKITSPLQALEEIRELCRPPMTSYPTYEMFRRQVNEAALAGIAHAVPLPAPTRKAARDLVPGDVLLFGELRQVVTLSATGANGPYVSVSSVVLGADEPVRVNLHAPDSQFTVEAPAGLTPVQAAADTLLDYARAYLECAINERVPSMPREEGEALSVMLDELDPPKPPTLEEAMGIIQALENAARQGTPAQVETAVADAGKFLKRWPN